MNRRTFLKAVPATLLAAQASGLAMAAGDETSAPGSGGGAARVAGDLQPIVLPKPETEGGKSVLAALKERRTIRSIKEDRLPLPVLSNLLWAAFGVNREKEGPFGQLGRTAASASNSQEIDLYVALPEGVYLYEAPARRLTPVLAGDLRGLAGNRGRGAKAPVRIIFVADIARFATAGFQEPGLKDPEVQKSYYNVATGLIAGNIYLFAASQGLAAWFHNCDKPGLAKALHLRPEQRVLYAQSVGYPA
jgi:nitroreductase